MVGVLDILDAVNLLARVEALIGRLIFADWKGTARRGGPAGTAAEFGRALVGANAWELRIRRDGQWSGRDVAEFLRHYGVQTWAGRTTTDHFIMYVKERQANWAEYLLRRRGIPLESPVYNPANLGYAQKYAPGDQPPAWADRETSRKGLADRLLDWFS